MGDETSDTWCPNRQSTVLYQGPPRESGRSTYHFRAWRIQAWEHAYPITKISGGTRFGAKLVNRRIILALDRPSLG